MYSKILVPLDGSDLAEAVLPYAAEIARRFGSQMVLLQVVDSFEKVVAEMMPATLEPTAAAAMVEVDVAEEQVRAEHEQAEKYLREVSAQLEAEGLTVERVVVEGDADDEIARYAHENGVDLVAMSTHGRSGLERLFYGSVAEATIKKLLCPALIIRSQEHHRRNS